MKRTEIRALFASAPADGASVTVCGCCLLYTSDAADE